MYPLGLTVAEREEFARSLCASRQVRVRVDILDMDQNFLGSVKGRILTGQVDVDATAQVTRSAGLTILDPDHMLNLDSSATFGGSLFLDRMIRIWYGVRLVETAKWVDVPVFTGPINQLSRDGDAVSLNALGKESLLLGPASTHRTWKTGTYKTTILRELLSMFGERFMEIPHQPTKTTSNVSIAPTTIPWDYAQSIARSWGGGRVIYDGMGSARYEQTSDQVQWVFRGGPGGSLVTRPKVGYDMANVRNLVVVIGSPPAKGCKPVSALAHAPAAHPLSAVSLGRAGGRRYLREDIEDSTITTVADAQKLADTKLLEHLNTGVQLDYSSLVIPHLEGWDMVRVESGKWSTSASLTQFTIPLTADGTMSIGRRYIVHRHVRERNTARKSPRR